MIPQSPDIAAIPGWIFLAVLPVVISLGGQIALSPILLVVLLGEILRGVDTLPTGQAQIRYVRSVGRALSMMASPECDGHAADLCHNTDFPDHDHLVLDPAIRSVVLRLCHCSP